MDIHQRLIDARESAARHAEATKRATEEWSDAYIRLQRARQDGTLASTILDMEQALYRISERKGQAEQLSIASGNRLKTVEKDLSAEAYRLSIQHYEETADALVEALVSVLEANSRMGMSTPPSLSISRIHLPACDGGRRGNDMNSLIAYCDLNSPQLQAKAKARLDALMTQISEAAQ